MVRRHGGRAHDDPRAVRLEHVPLVLAHLVRADEDAAVPAALGDEGQADAGVAGGRLDDRAAGPQLTGLLGGLDHLQRDPVLHRPAGVEVLHLGQHGGRDALGHRREPDERGVADEVADVLCVLHAPSIPAPDDQTVRGTSDRGVTVDRRTIRTGFSSRCGVSTWGGRARRAGSRPRRRTAAEGWRPASSVSARSRTACCSPRPRSPGARSAPSSSRHPPPTAGTTRTAGPRPDRHADGAGRARRLLGRRPGRRAGGGDARGAARDRPRGRLGTAGPAGQRGLQRGPVQRPGRPARAAAGRAAPARRGDDDGRRERRDPPGEGRLGRARPGRRP